MTEERYAELQARCWQTQHELDRCAQDLERLIRVFDRTPDGLRASEVRQRMSRALDRKNAAEREAGRAADEFIAYEAEHGPMPQSPEQQALPIEDALRNQMADIDRPDRPRRRKRRHQP